tara:strand:- start:914 stop:1696 length:783 start_codon:yes stop_codon:yes gene_type:complete
MSTSRLATTLLFRKLKGRSLGIFLLEVSAIIIGLTVSFMIDEWRQEQKQRKQEIEILKGIAEDLKADREFVHMSIQWCNDRTNIRNDLLNLADFKTVKKDTLQKWISDLVGFNGFMPNDHTYKSIAADARTIITDTKLREKLQTYYSWDYGLAYDWEEHDKKLAEERKNYIREQLVAIGVKRDQRNFLRVEYDLNSLKPILQDPYFRSLLQHSIASDQGTIFFAERRLATIDSIEHHFKTIGLEQLSSKIGAPIDGRIKM